MRCFLFVMKEQNQHGNSVGNSVGFGWKGILISKILTQGRVSKRTGFERVFIWFWKRHTDLCPNHLGQSADELGCWGGV